MWSSPNNIATSLGIRANTRLDLGVQASVYMTILSSGNVGIGTTSPDYKLEVKGAISSADAGLQKATFANVGNDLVLTGMLTQQMQQLKCCLIAPDQPFDLVSTNSDYRIAAF